MIFFNSLHRITPLIKCFSYQRAKKIYIYLRVVNKTKKKTNVQWSFTKRSHFYSMEIKESPLGTATPKSHVNSVTLHNKIYTISRFGMVIVCGKPVRSFTKEGWVLLSTSLTDAREDGLCCCLECIPRDLSGLLHPFENNGVWSFLGILYFFFNLNETLSPDSLCPNKPFCLFGF